MEKFTKIEHKTLRNFGTKVPSSVKPTPELKVANRDLSVNQVSQRRRRAPGISRRGRRLARTGMIPRLPPMIDTTPVLNSVFRFVSNTNVVTPVTAANLILVPGMICTTTNSVCASIASTVRIKRITIWPPPNSTTMENAEVQWYGGNNEKDDSKDSSLPVGVTITGAVTSVPPAEALASSWIAPGLTTTTIFSLQAPTGSIIDVEMNFVVSNNIANQTTAVATGVLTSFYYHYMDGSTNHKFQPVGRPSTF